MKMDMRFAHGNFWRRASHLAIVILLSFWLQAQTSPDQDLTSLSVEELARSKVFSASRHLEDSREAPSAVSIITSEDIARYGWRTLSEALRSLRGFYTSYDRNYSYLGVRGFLRAGDYNSRILLLVNGHRLNDNVYDSAQIGTEFPIDMDLVDRIEIVRGPSSSLFGSNAVFGVINVITRRPKDSAIETSADTSSYMGRTGRVGASFQKNRLSGIVSGSMYRSNGASTLFFPEFNAPETNRGVAKNIDGDRYDHAFGDLQYGNLRVQGAFSTRNKLLPTASFDTIFNQPGTRTTDSRGYLDVSYHRTLKANTDLDVRAYYDAYRYHGTYVYPNIAGSQPILNLDDGIADWSGVETTLSRKIGRHRITAGADYEYNFRVDQKNYDLGGLPVVSDHRAPWRAATFAEGELKLPAKLTLHAGGRMDWFSAYGVSLSPRIALVYEPSSKTTVKYIFGRAFRAPNAYESYYVDNVVIVAPAAQLKPEGISSHELVLEHSFKPWLRVTTEGFYNNLTNLIDQQPDPASGLTHFVNSGRDHGRGVEAEVEAKKASGFAARASYTLAHAEDVIAMQRLQNSPLHTTKLNMTIPVSHNAFGGVEFLYSSAQTSYLQTRVPPWFLTNVTLSTKPLWGGWEFSGSCYNALDRRWYSPAGPGFRQASIQQDGRAFRFKASYRLPFGRKQKNLLADNTIRTGGNAQGPPLTAGRGREPRP